MSRMEILIMASLAGTAGALAWSAVLARALGKASAKAKETAKRRERAESVLSRNQEALRGDLLYMEKLLMGMQGNLAAAREAAVAARRESVLRAGAEGREPSPRETPRREDVLSRQLAEALRANAELLARLNAALEDADRRRENAKGESQRSDTRRTPAPTARPHTQASPGA